ncbi:hypothetical protein [Natronosalvus rutilus]|uniref:DUF8152 domain-containing protein n=1 Tax=Natronosalvus rutilus TaxID=2953753 RepID=A0A9E7SUT7_9EURY|nr:hypothetical protein [Natronosalvus rutilus]UTF52316.1 hypothetical protein NGM29_10990 [Natronosalvus rutilus]
MADPDSLEARLHRLHDHLEATAELPIDRRTNRWLGEAEAVARDAAVNDLDEATSRKRVRQVAHLLAEADSPENERAKGHLESARELCTAVLADSSEG